MKTAREEQIQTLRDSAEALRSTVKQTREEAAAWQQQADRAREKADRDEENARVWELLADALDAGRLDDIVVPLGTGRKEPTNARIHALQGRLMTQLAEYQLDAWNIHCRQLTAMLHQAHGGSRKAILNIADRLRIGYSEEDRGEKVFVAASGEIDGIEVEIWSLLPAEDEQAEVKDAERTTLAEQLRAHGAEQAAQDAEADAFHAQRRADEAEANGEYVDYAEAEAVREIEREMAIEAGDDSELDRQVAEDDARFERAVWLAQQDTEAFERHQANIARDTESAPACARCKIPFDPEDKSYTGSAQHDDTPYCEGCIDNCHEAGADHRCIICVPRVAESGS